MSRLESIKLTSFKGASNPIEINFQRDSNFAVIFGENGTGKSTIVDSFDFICNESNGSLQDKHLGTNPGKYIVTINSNSNNLEVELKHNGNVWTARFGLRFRPSVTGPQGKPDSRILRREKIQKLLVSEASDRYEAIKNIIDTSKIDKLYSEINKLKIQKERDYNSATRALSDAKDALEQLWTRLNKPGSNYIDWAITEIKDSIQNISEKKNKLDEIIELFSRLMKGNDKINEVKDILNVKNTQLVSKKADFERNAAEVDVSIKELIDVLKTAYVYYSVNPTSETCPVCEQPAIPTNVAQSLKNRLEEMQSFVALKTEIDSLERTLIENNTTLDQYYSRFINIAENLYLELKNSNIEEIKSAEINYDACINLVNQRTSIVEKLELANAFFDDIKSKFDNIPNIINTLHDRISRFEFIKNHLDIIREKTQTAEYLQILNQRVTWLHEIINSKRNEYVRDVLNTISTDIDIMYQKIHPGENIGGIQLEVDPDRRASLDIKGKFSTETDILPQAYYSESHLDTLGICLFIALSKHYRTPDTILILDDVITSADQVHLNRFIRMLEDELPNFAHTIVTTHYQVWRDKYRYGAGNAQIIELMGWSLERGLRHTKTKLYVEELEHYRNTEPMDKQIVASKAGIFLELILDNLALQYQCKLPRKREQNYTLGELLGGFSARLKRNMKVQIVDNGTVTQEINLEEKMNVLPAESPIRNQVGCHFNEVGANYSEDDIKEMADKTIDLANDLICNDCGELPFRSGSGTYYECKCKKKRLYPLTEPS